MTRSPDATKAVSNDNEFELINDPSGVIEESNDIRNFRILCLQMADKCSRLLPTGSADRSAADDVRCIVGEQAVQTDNEMFSVETDKLKQKLKEVVDMNVGWQLLHGQQEKRIAELMSQLQQLTSHSCTSPAERQRSHDSTAEQQQQRQEPQSADDVTCAAENDEVAMWKAKYDQLEHEKNDLEATVRCLTSQLDSTHDLLRQLESAVDQQNAKLDSVISEKQSFIDVLQAQVLVYREDFESERNDRERAQSKIVELKTELELLNKRMTEQQALRYSSTRPSANAFYEPLVPRTCPPYNDYHQILPTAMQARHEAAPFSYYPAANEARFAARDPRFYPRVGIDEVDCTTDCAESEKDPINIGQGGEMVTDGASWNGDQSAAAEGSREVGDALRCPCCQRSFTLDQHVDLMDHMDVCRAAG